MNLPLTLTLSLTLAPQCTRGRDQDHERGSAGGLHAGDYGELPNLTEFDLQVQPPGGARDALEGLALTLTLTLTLTERCDGKGAFNRS